MRAVVLFALVAACSDAPKPTPVHARPPEPVAAPTAAPIAPPPAPPPALAPTDVVELHASKATTCAKRADASLWCWGIGFGTTPERVYEATGAASFTVDERGIVYYVVDGKLAFRRIKKISDPLYGKHDLDVAWVATGGFTSCVATASGELRCWDYARELAPVPDIATASSVAIAGSFACALDRDGGVRCWGKATTTLAQAKQLVAGDHFVCALVASGAVQCWGDRPGSWHVPGHSRETLAGPTAMPELANATQLFAGADTVCARRTDGSVACTGVDVSPKHDGGASLPAGTAALAIGDTFACALGGDHHVRCWGDRSDGHLGDGRDLGQATPVAVDVGPGALALGTGTCALAGGKATCVGGRHVDGKDPVVGTDLLAVSFGWDFACAVHASHGVTCWGAARYGALGTDEVVHPYLEAEVFPYLGPRPVLHLDDAVQIASGWSFSCAVESNGKVACWGESAGGQLGRGAHVKNPSPAPAFGITDAVEVRTADNGACVRRKNGAVACWGSGLLFADMQDRPTPTAIRGVTGATALAVGRVHACALLRDGSVMCWGDGSLGQLGDGGERGAKSFAPQQVNRIAGATAIAAGGDTTCAIVDGGKVACWGRNDWGQGGADRDARIQFPRTVEGIDGATDLAMGRRHACARVAGGEVRCWGYVGDDALGPAAPRVVRDAVEVKLVK